MKLTYQDTEMLRTPKGGFRASTLALLGISWPPKKGWRYRLMETDIPQELFELALHDCEVPTTSKCRGAKKLRDERIRRCKQLYKQHTSGDK